MRRRPGTEAVKVEVEVEVERGRAGRRVRDEQGWSLPPGGQQSVERVAVLSGVNGTVNSATGEGRGSAEKERGPIYHRLVGADSRMHSHVCNKIIFVLNLHGTRVTNLSFSVRTQTSHQTKNVGSPLVSPTPPPGTSLSCPG